MQSNSRLGHASLAAIRPRSTAPRLRRAACAPAAVVGILAGRRVAARAPPRASPAPRPFVQVRIDQVTPQVVTTTSEPVVTVTGTVTNIGDRPVRDVMVRLEHAAGGAPRRRVCAPTSTAAPTSTSPPPTS